MKKYSPQLIINKQEIAVFPKDFYCSDLADIAARIKKSTPDLNGSSTVLPIPDDAPRDIPRILIRSKNGVLNCDVSFNRINIYWVNKKESVSFKMTISQMQKVVGSIMKIILEDKKIKRVGFITEFFFASKTPAEEITSKLLHKNMVKVLSNFVVNLTYSKSLNSYSKCNQVVNIANGITTSGNKESVVLITNDINTHQTDDVNWDIKKMNEFIAEVDAESDIEHVYRQFIK